MLCHGIQKALGIGNYTVVRTCIQDVPTMFSKRGFDLGSLHAVHLHDRPALIPQLDVEPQYWFRCQGLDRLLHPGQQGGGAQVRLWRAG